MSQQSERDLQAELDALRQRLGNLEAEYRELLGRAPRPRRAGFSRKFLIGALPAALLLGAGGLLYGQAAVDALFIDKAGNATFSGKVGIGKAPDQDLDVKGSASFSGQLQVVGKDQEGGLAVLKNGSGLASLLIKGPGRGDNAYARFEAHKESAAIPADLVLQQYGGNVGIGIKPQARMRLDVKGTAQVVTLIATDDVTVGKRPVAGGNEPLRILRGSIDEGGKTLGGSGFSVKKVGLGLYDISFAESFSSPPAASVTQVFPGKDKTGGYTTDNAIIVLLESNSMRVKTGGSNGSASDRKFTFLVIGPR